VRDCIHAASASKRAKNGRSARHNTLRAAGAVNVFIGDCLRIVLDAPALKGFVVKRTNIRGLSALSPRQQARVGDRPALEA
jgi:hypothetical protein